VHQNSTDCVEIKGKNIFAVTLHVLRQIFAVTLHVLRQIFAVTLHVLRQIFAVTLHMLRQIFAVTLHVLRQIFAVTLHVLRQIFAVTLHMLRQTLFSLAPPRPFHLHFPSYCDVAQAQSYFASTVLPHILLITFCSEHWLVALLLNCCI
jgi:hypothetical protein